MKLLKSLRIKFNRISSFKRVSLMLNRKLRAKTSESMSPFLGSQES